MLKSLRWHIIAYYMHLFMLTLVNSCLIGNHITSPYFLYSYHIFLSDIQTITQVYVGILLSLTNKTYTVGIESVYWYSIMYG